MLDLRGGIVLRTGHAHGLPIRPPGPNPRIPAEVHLIDALYGDDLVSESSPTTVSIGVLLSGASR